MRFSTRASLVWTFPPCYVSSWETAPLCCLWPFCGRRSALQGCHITPSSLCCLSFPSFTISLSLSPASPLPLCMCRVSCVLQPCHYWAAGITPLPMSCLSALALSLATFSLSFNPLASMLPMAILHHLYTPDRLSLIDVAHNTMQPWHAISIPQCVFPSTRMLCEHHSVIMALNDWLKSNRIYNVWWLMLWYFPV